MNERRGERRISMRKRDQDQVEIPLQEKDGRTVTYLPKKRSIIIEGEVVRISKTQNAILQLLTRTPLQVVKRADIYCESLGLEEAHATSDREIKSYLKPTMHRLKERLASISPGLERTIRNAYGYGYMFFPDTFHNDKPLKSGHK